MRSLFIACLAVLAITTVDAHAASFDCRKAHSPDETAICESHELSELDAVMGAYWYIYRQLPFLMGMSGVRRDEAGEFLQKRAACGPRVPCLRELYRARIKTLREQISSALDDIKRRDNQ
jgi:uncharacterized protein